MAREPHHRLMQVPLLSLERWGNYIECAIAQQQLKLACSNSPTNVLMSSFTDMIPSTR